MTTSTELLAAATAAYGGLPLTLDGKPGDAERGFSYQDGPLTVSGRFIVRSGTAKLTSITVADSTGLAAADVRNLHFGRITGSLAALTALETAGREGIAAAYPSAAATAAAHRRMTVHARRGGPPRLTDDRLQRLAEAYLRETAPGMPARPTVRLAAGFGAPEDTVRTWLARCRKDGWLTASVKGRAGGEPGPRLLLARLQSGSTE